MSAGKVRPLSSGPSIGGSLESKIIIVLVIVIVLLGAATFALYSTVQSQDKSLKSRQADYDAISANMSQLSSDYATLNGNFTRLTGDFANVKANYDNISSQYLALQNRSSTVDSRLSSFLENDPTIAYIYTVAPKLLPDNSTDILLTVTAYNLGKLDIGNIKIMCTVKEGNATNVYNKTYTYVRSMDKRQAQWEFDNATQIVDVWAGLG